MARTTYRSGQSRPVAKDVRVAAGGTPVGCCCSSSLTNAAARSDAPVKQPATESGWPWAAGAPFCGSAAPFLQPWARQVASGLHCSAEVKSCELACQSSKRPCGGAAGRGALQLSPNSTQFGSVEFGIFGNSRQSGLAEFGIDRIWRETLAKIRPKYEAEPRQICSAEFDQTGHSRAGSSRVNLSVGRGRFRRLRLTAPSTGTG
jgi:hypothetical protein